MKIEGGTEGVVMSGSRRALWINSVTDEILYLPKQLLKQ